MTNTLTVRPTPTPAAQAAAAARIDWDKPAGYAHAASILRTLDATGRAA